MKDYDKVFKQMDNAFKEVDNAFKEVDKVFKEVDSIMVKATIVARKEEVGPWKEWFAWYPVKVHGKRKWMKKVFRRKINTYVDMDDWSRYEYGTVFDAIKDPK